MRLRSTFPSQPDRQAISKYGIPHGTALTVFVLARHRDCSRDQIPDLESM
jgi:hypothetical protein